MRAHGRSWGDAGDSKGFRELAGRSPSKSQASAPQRAFVLGSSWQPSRFPRSGVVFFEVLILAASWECPNDFKAVLLRMLPWALHEEEELETSPTDGEKLVNIRFPHCQKSILWAVSVFAGPCSSLRVQPRATRKL